MLIPRYFFASAIICSALTTAAQGGTVVGGSLLTGGDATYLETFIGLGNLDFTNIWTGTTGVSTAESFHAAADGVGATVSVFDITLGDGSNARVGGYTALDWGTPPLYNVDEFTTLWGLPTHHHADHSAFLFNLTTGEVQTAQEPQYAHLAVYIGDHAFPSFGAADLSSGFGTLGTNQGKWTNAVYDGVSSSYTYDRSQGQITIAGDSGVGSGDSGYANSHWSVNSLEVYSVATANVAPVPLPAGLPLLLGALGLTGLVARKRRKA